MGNGLLKVEYYQEIIPDESGTPDFSIRPDLLTPRSDGIPPGDYLAGALQGTFQLDYATFDRWRRILCLAVLDYEAESVWSNPDVFTGEPFYELIHCEKQLVFGPLTSQKLAEDFRTWEEDLEHKVASQVEIQEYHFFMDIFGLFRKAFSVAGNTGCTIFS